MLRLGLDIGGTKIEAVVLTEQGELLHKQRTATQKESYAQFVDDVTHIISQIRTRFTSPMSVGICLPGSVSPLTGLIKNSNILVLNGEPLPQDLHDRLGQPVTLSNDGNCFALSEAVDGAGKDHDIVFGVILGTGCGGGLAIGKRMIAGNNGNAGECGHNPLPGYDEKKDGAPARCYCGQTNCVESFVSGTGLSERYLLRTGERLKANDIVALAEQGHPAASAQFELYLDQLARSLASIVNHIDPGAIVLGGGMSNIQAIYQTIEQRVANYVFTDRFTTRIVQAQHGDSSGVRGAAWLG
jgi:fructokinase